MDLVVNQDQQVAQARLDQLNKLLKENLIHKQHQLVIGFKRQTLVLKFKKQEQIPTAVIVIHQQQTQQ